MAHKPSLSHSSAPSFPPESALHDDGSAFGGMSEFSSTSLPNSPTVNKEVELLGERLDGEPASFKRAPKKVSSWRSSVTSLATQRAVTRKLARRYWEKLDTLDRFAVQPEPASRLGAGLTLFVWGATTLYIIIAVFQWMRKPPVVAANSEWSIDKGPFLMLMECHARSGCLVSSNLPVHELEGSNSTLRDTCVRVPYQETLRVPMVYTEDPLEGLSVLYDPGTSDDKVLPRFGVATVSEIQCKPEKGKGCVDYRRSAAGPGVSSVTIVRIVNQTEIGAAKLRLLAFSGSSTMNETVNKRVTPCKPDPSWKEAAQTCLKMGSVYFDVNVYMDNFWLYLWGSAGGAYSSFFEICTILLIAYAFTSKVYKKLLKGKVARLRQVACTSWAPGRAYKPEQEEVEGKQDGGALV